MIYHFSQANFQEFWHPRLTPPALLINDLIGIDTIIEFKNLKELKESYSKVTFVLLSIMNSLIFSDVEFIEGGTGKSELSLFKNRSFDKDYLRLSVKKYFEFPEPFH